jgi:hypothetical protein
LSAQSRKQPCAILEMVLSRPPFTGLPFLSTRKSSLLHFCSRCRLAQSSSVHGFASGYFSLGSPAKGFAAGKLLVEATILSSDTMLAVVAVERGVEEEGMVAGCDTEMDLDESLSRTS